MEDGGWEREDRGGRREDGGGRARLPHETPTPTGSSVLFLCLPSSLPYGAPWGADDLEVCFCFPEVQVHQSVSSREGGLGL